MEFLSEYGMFLLKMFTFIFGVLGLLIGIIAIAGKDKSGKPKLTVKKLNQRYDEMADTLREAILDKKAYAKFNKQEKKNNKPHKDDEARKRVFLIEFDGDIRATAVKDLREEVTAILKVASPADEVVVRLESPGGLVSAYGLAASQLKRITDKHIPLTACVDKVAASGGYMMACVADRIIAAPFSIIGSVGVVAQIPNFNRLLKKNHVDFELITAGEFKRTVTIFGENTDKARKKMQEELEDILTIFKEFVSLNRPVVNIDEVATGEHWLAKRALDLRMVDDLQSSDDYLLQASNDADIFLVKHKHKKKVTEKLAAGANLFLNSVTDGLSRNQTDYL